MEHVSITTSGGLSLPGFKSVQVEASVQHAARSFTTDVSLTLGGGGPEAAFFAPVPVVITTRRILPNGLGPADLLFTGAVDHATPKLNGREASATISGRSKGADAVDCSADHTKGDYTNKTLLQVAQDQDATGIGFSADYAMDPIDQTRPNIGESLFGFLRSHLDAEMATMSGQPDGSIRFTRAGVNPPRQPGYLIEGVTFFDGSADFDWTKRHAEYHVHGQSYKGTGPSATQLHAKETDGAITRARKVHVVHPGHTDANRVAKHVKNHKNAAVGEGTRLTYRSSTWRDNTGALWVPGNKVWVEVPTLGLIQDMLIEHVTYKLDATGGEYAHLDLVDPRAHGGQGGSGVNKSSSEWGVPS